MGNALGGWSTRGDRDDFVFRGNISDWNSEFQLRSVFILLVLFINHVHKYCNIFIPI